MFHLSLQETGSGQRIKEVIASTPDKKLCEKISAAYLDMYPLPEHTWIVMQESDYDDPKQYMAWFNKNKIVKEP
jgi:hypothetical protein